MLSVFGFLKFLFFTSILLKSTPWAEGIDNFIYHGFNETSLKLSESARIVPKSRLLELTNISYQQIGRAFFPTPIKFTKSFSFSTQFAFAIVPGTPTLGGHGFMFVISPSTSFPGALAVEWLGIFNDKTIGQNSDHVFGVEFDTIKTVGFQDINENHVGIDVNNLVSNVSAPASYFDGNENKSLLLISGDPMRAWIDYDDDDKLINVTIAPLRSKKPEKPLLSTTIDLSSVLLDSVYVGFSSSTGTMSSHHYILGWSFNTTGPAEDLEISKLPRIPHASAKHRKKLDLLVLLALITAGVLLILVLLAAFYIFRSKKLQEIREDWETEYGPQRFTYKELKQATKGFDEKELLGLGGFGQVYRGTLPSSNQQVAVKKFSHESQQGMTEFKAEISSMGRLRHRNLVQLFGYCSIRGELLLVYDYMPKGSLDKFLFNEEQKLNWFHRFKILKDVAAALLYLHEQWEQVVIHRDVKASNVMLDGDLTGKLGDFGLAKFYDHGTIPETTRVVGTVGYLAPEVSRAGRVTTSSDVYAFGVVMLEVATGRRAIEPKRAPREAVLVDWVFECWKRGDIVGASDPRLEGKFMEEEMELVLKLGLLCTQGRPADRPIMRQVVQYLDRKVAVPEIPTGGGGWRNGAVRVDLEEDEDCGLALPESTGGCSAMYITHSIHTGR